MASVDRRGVLDSRGDGTHRLRENIIDLAKVTLVDKCIGLSRKAEILSARVFARFVNNDRRAAVPFRDADSDGRAIGGRV
jgi:hypothetical protein